MRTRIKICGITRSEDGRRAAGLGADAIGLVFYPPSPRAVSLEQARAVAADLPGFVTLVALFVDPVEEEVARVLEAIPVDVIQFHGQESAAFCRGFGRRYIKAVRMREDIDPHRLADEYADACGLLLDTWRAGTPGGTGETFDWAMVPEALSLPVILAGGLAADNVADAIGRVRPWAVDVSGGVEENKGIKNAGKMQSFFRAVAVADSKQR